MSDEPLASPPHVSANLLLRWAIGLVIGVVILLVVVGRRGQLVAAIHELSRLNWGWGLAALAAEALSVVAFAYLQRNVLKVSGAVVSFSHLTVLSLANIAIANTIPGEPVVSCAYRYRSYRRHGASAASSAWTILTILIAQALGMSLILLLGVLVSLGSDTGVAETGIALVGLVVVLGAGWVLVHQDLLLAVVGALIRIAQRVTGHPRRGAAERLEDGMARMREIPLTTSSTLSIVWWAWVVWFLDFLCLLASFAGVHAAVPWNGVLLAYGVAQIAAALPIVPGGVGIVEGSLAVVLVAYGTTHVAALAVVLVYRLLTFWIAAAVGWCSVGALEWAARRGPLVAVELSTD